MLREGAADPGAWPHPQLLAWAAQRDSIIATLYSQTLVLEVHVRLYTSLSTTGGQTIRLWICLIYISSAYLSLPYITVLILS